MSLMNPYVQFKIDFGDEYNKLQIHGYHVDFMNVMIGNSVYTITSYG